MSNIKINDVPQRIQYLATGGQTQFTIPFPFFQNNYVYVWLNGIQIFQGGAPGQYVVTGAGSPSGGLVTFNTAATLNDIVTIEGIMPIDRTSIYSATISNLTGSDLNGDFNREVVMLQQLNTTQSFMQLQYPPWVEISQDLTVTTDRYIPLLPAGYGWRKNMAGTAIEAISIPDGGFAPQVGSFVTVSDERSDLPSSFPLFDLGNASTGGMGIPAGTTAQRVVPIAPNIGLRFNTDLDIIEAYIDGVWVEIPSSAAGLFLPLVGGTMSGAIDMGAELITNLLDPVSPQDAATKNYVDTMIGGTAGGVGGNIQWNDAGAFGGDPNFNTDGAGNVTIDGSLEVDNLSFNGNRISATTGLVELEDAQLFNDLDADFNKIINLDLPTLGGDAANKTYVDSVAAGFYFLEPVVVASTANFTSTYANGTAGVGATLTATVNGAASIDGVSLALNNRVLFKNQSTTFQNGIYFVSQVGSGGTPAIYTRALDYDEPSDIDTGDMITVLQGAVNASSFWVETATVTTIGTDPITFTQFGISAANIVTISGTQTITGAKSFTLPITLPSTAILDQNGNTILGFIPQASAVNFITFDNSVTLGYPSLSADGPDTDIGVTIVAKGAGILQLQTQASSPALLLLTGTSFQHATALHFANTAASKVITVPDLTGTMGIYTTGTWTPIDASGAGLIFTSVSGNYQQIGNIVTANCIVVYPSTASGASAIIGGLPVITGSTNGKMGGAVVKTTVATLSNATTLPSNTAFGLFTSAGAAVTNAAMSLSTTTFQITYFV